ncbi:hypothetical protein F5X68DRAFT_8744 [Plectosphaerella plurivora]|uniref:Uncharacterized protein n=1 Tax=Plectosphaerella plurivora TaxID=936078 RepID=A0A9P8VBT8_9PEZI|nr:hypothetical protein F5X68DRAFT_8744 [Plectosphaerella plurivora]
MMSLGEDLGWAATRITTRRRLSPVDLCFRSVARKENNSVCWGRAESSHCTSRTSHLGLCCPPLCQVSAPRIISGMHGSVGNEHGFCRWAGAHWSSRAAAVGFDFGRAPGFRLQARLQASGQASALQVQFRWDDRGMGGSAVPSPVESQGKQGPPSACPATRLTPGTRTSTSEGPARPPVSDDTAQGSKMRAEAWLMRIRRGKPSRRATTTTTGWTACVDDCWWVQARGGAPSGAPGTVCETDGRRPAIACLEVVHCTIMEASVVCSESGLCKYGTQRTTAHSDEQ